jgi:hypothetical protein
LSITLGSKNKNSFLNFREKIVSVTELDLNVRELRCRFSCFWAEMRKIEKEVGEDAVNGQKLSVRGWMTKAIFF